MTVPRTFPLATGLFVGLVTLLAVPAPRLAARNDVPASNLLPADSTVTTGRLANGLRYYIRNNARPARRAILRLVVNVGSVVEEDDQRGIAHFVEHMAFNGTARFPRSTMRTFLGTVGSSGAHANASTSFDETIYRLDVPTDVPNVLDRAFVILEDWAHRLSFDDDAVERERAVITEEWRQRRGANARVLERELPIQFEGSRYAARLPIGTTDVIQGVDPARLRRFYADWYRPDLMAVVAVGDFNREAVESEIRRRFDGLTRRGVVRERFVYDVPPHDGTRVSVSADPETLRSTVEIKHLVPSHDRSSAAGHRQTLVDSLFATLLTARYASVAGRDSSPFVRATATRRGSIARPADETAIAAVVRDGRLEQALEAMIAEVERARRFGFSSAELDRAKQNALRLTERLLAESGNRESEAHADDYVRHFLRGDPIASVADRVALDRRVLATIELADVAAAASEWFPNRNRTVEVSVPDTPGTIRPSIERLSAVVDTARIAPLARYVELTTAMALMPRPPERGRVTASRLDTESGVTEWTLANGARVVLKPTTTRNDEVILRAARPGGTSVVSDADFPAIVAAAQIANAGGVGQHSQPELRRALTGRIATVTPFIAEIEEGLAGSASPRDIETLFELVHLRFTQPRTDRAAFNTLRTQTRALQANQPATPEFVFLSAVSDALTNGHPRRRVRGPEAADAWDLDKAMAFYRERFASARGFTFVLAGNVAPDVLEPLIARYIASLPSSEAESHWRDVGVRSPAGIVERTVTKGVEPKSQVAVAFAGDFNDTAPNRATLRMLAGVLESALMSRLRQQMGGTYSVTVRHAVQRAPVPRYELRIVWSCDPRRVNDLARRVFQEIRDVSTAPLPELLVRNVRTSIVRNAHELLQQNAYLATQLVAAYELGDPPSTVWSLPQDYQRVTSAMIRDAAGRYLTPERYVRVTLEPDVR